MLYQPDPRHLELEREAPADSETVLDQAMLGVLIPRMWIFSLTIHLPDPSCHASLLNPLLVCSMKSFFQPPTWSPLREHAVCDCASLVHHPSLLILGVDLLRENFTRHSR